MRYEDWPQKFDAYLLESKGKAFTWGEFDCCMFAADWVALATGIDPAASVRGYDSKIEAYRIIAEHGSLEALVSALMQQQPKHPAWAARGDLVLADMELADGGVGECVGVWDKIFGVFPQGTGLRFVPRSAVKLAWSVE